ncbi:MAG: chorismate mutase [Oscillospiraceae bacterium]|nr:chorismate mutase [Oscillospiraceae bacterium]
MEELTQLRGEIDAIDRQIAALLQQRMDVTGRVGQYKMRHGMKVLDVERERQVLAAKTELSDDPAVQSALVTLFEAIMAISRRQQHQMVREDSPDYDAYLAARAAARMPLERPRVLYQGEPGAYADQAAEDFFGPELPRNRVDTWEEIFQALQNGLADYGVVPIENSSTGSILQVYDLLARYGAYIVGEQTVRVSHCLLAPPGASLEGLKDVYSHEQGLSQCAPFLKEHPDWGRHAMLNTAAAAKYVSETGDKTKAAIGSRRCAGLYGLESLAEDVNFNKNNFTRFVVVSPVLEKRPGADKISVQFTLPHHSGTLHQIMSVFAVAGLNMVKLESRPIPGKSWEYLLFADFTGNLDELGGIVRELTQIATRLRILGNYKSGGD